MLEVQWVGQWRSVISVMKLIIVSNNLQGLHAPCVCRPRLVDMREILAPKPSDGVGEGLFTSIHTFCMLRRAAGPVGCG